MVWITYLTLSALNIFAWSFTVLIDLDNEMSGSVLYFTYIKEGEYTCIEKQKED